MLIVIREPGVNISQHIYPITDIRGKENLHDLVRFIHLL
jgi:hypothetical protein